MNVVLGLARFGFLGLIAVFLVYLVWLLKRDVNSG
jgi:hypothetical protein